MTKEHLMRLTEEQLEALLAQIQSEIDDRRVEAKKDAWEKVKTAIKEYLKIDSIRIENLDAGIYMDKEDTLNMTDPGCIKVNF